MVRKTRKKKSTSIWKILFAAIFIGPILLTNIRITIGILVIVLFFRMPYRRLGSFVRSIFAPSNRSANLESNTFEKPQHQTKRITDSQNLVSKPPQKNVSTEKPDIVTARDSDNPRNKKSNFQNQVQPFGNVPLESNNAALIGVRWVPPGESVIVHDILIPNGMVYVGQKSKNPEWREPSHIDTSLSIGIIQTADYEADSMPYWPSYEWIQLEERAAYLRWLSEGKKAKQVSIGYVFLYFYGLERRLLVDIPTDHFASIERPQIVQEIKRLLTIYGDNRSFFNYATSLLSLIECHDLVLETIPAEPPLLEKGTQISFLLRLSLAGC